MSSPKRLMLTTTGIVLVGTCVALALSRERRRGIGGMSVRLLSYVGAGSEASSEVGTATTADVAVSVPVSTLAAGDCSSPSTAVIPVGVEVVSAGDMVSQALTVASGVLANDVVPVGSVGSSRRHHEPLTLRCLRVWNKLFPPPF